MVIELEVEEGSAGFTGLLIAQGPAGVYFAHTLTTKDTVTSLGQPTFYKEGKISNVFTSYASIKTTAIGVWLDYFPDGEFLVQYNSIKGYKPDPNEPKILVDCKNCEFHSIRGICANLRKQYLEAYIPAKNEIINIYTNLLHKSKFRAKYLRAIEVNELLSSIENLGLGRQVCGRIEINSSGRLWYVNNVRHYLFAANWIEKLHESELFTKLLCYLKEYILVGAKIPITFLEVYPHSVQRGIVASGSKVFKF